MATNQGGVQQAIRDKTGTELDYNGDWMALFDSESIPNGSFNERMLAWINQTLGTSYTDLPGAQQAYAVDQGYNNWSSMGAIVLGPSEGPPNGILLEDGSSFLLAENNDYLIQEAA